jgi:hypothetical protein
MARKGEGYPPHYTHEYQNKGFTKSAIRKWLILKGHVLGCFGEAKAESLLEKEVREQKAPAVQLEFSLRCIVPKG